MPNIPVAKYESKSTFGKLKRGDRFLYEGLPLKKVTERLATTVFSGRIIELAEDAGVEV